MEISRKTYLLELSTMLHVVRKQIKCILATSDRVTFLLLDYVACVYSALFTRA